MSSESSLPFDPTETSPGDVYRGTREWIDDNSTILIASSAAVAIALIVAVGIYDMAIPSVPMWIKVFAGASIGAAAIAYLPGRALVEFLYQPETIVLVEVDAASGDLAVHEISPDRFNEITVVDHADQEHPRSFLHKISTMKGVGYEVDRYDVESNIAVASWMAGATDKEIRATEFAVQDIKRNLSIQADRAYDLEVNQESIIRAALSEVANDMIRTSQGVRVPNGDLISESINKILDREVPDALETAKKQAEKDNDAPTQNDTQNDAQTPQNEPETAVADGGPEA